MCGFWAVGEPIDPVSVCVVSFASFRLVPWAFRSFVERKVMTVRGGSSFVRSNLMNLFFLTAYGDAYRLANVLLRT